MFPGPLEAVATDNLSPLPPIRYAQPMNLASQCRPTREGLTEYLEDALSPRRRQGLESHLEACGGCRGYLAELRHAVERTGRLPREAMPDTVRARLLDRFRER